MNVAHVQPLLKEVSLHISRGYRPCVIVAIDQSGSMRRRIGSTTFAQLATQLANRAIWNMLQLSFRGIGQIDHLFDVGLFGYGQNEHYGHDNVYSLFSDNATGDAVCNIQMVTDFVLEGGEEKGPTWCLPHSQGGTPMCRLFAEIGSHIARWVDKNPTGPPPVIINITDGFATDIPYEDADVRGWHERLARIATSGGVTKVFDVIIEENDPFLTLRPGSPSAVYLPGWTLPALDRLICIVNQSLWSSRSTFEMKADGNTLARRGRELDSLSSESESTSVG